MIPWIRQHRFTAAPGNDESVDYRIAPLCAACPHRGLRGLADDRQAWPQNRLKHSGTAQQEARRIRAISNWRPQ